MDTKILKSFAGQFPAIFAIVAFFLFSSLNKSEHKEDKITPEVSCCTQGYGLAIAQLRQFMLDSLKTRKFEGGIYKKSELLNVINSMNSDSVYIMNGMIDCDISKGTMLAVASTGNAKISFVNWYGSGYCYPCPKPCCIKKICVVSIDRACVVYPPLQATNAQSLNPGTITAEQ